MLNFSSNYSQQFDSLSSVILQQCWTAGYLFPKLSLFNMKRFHGKTRSRMPGSRIKDQGSGQNNSNKLNKFIDMIDCSPPPRDSVKISRENKRNWQIYPRDVIWELIRIVIKLHRPSELLVRVPCMEYTRKQQVENLKNTHGRFVSVLSVNAEC